MRTSSPKSSPLCFGSYRKTSEFCRKVCAHAVGCLKQSGGVTDELTREELLEELRAAFRRRDMLSLNALLEAGKRSLTDEDREKIAAAVERLGREGTLVEKALVMLGGKIVDTDPPQGVQ